MSITANKLDFLYLLGSKSFLDEKQDVGSFEYYLASSKIEEAD